MYRYDNHPYPIYTFLFRAAPIALYDIGHILEGELIMWYINDARTGVAGDHAESAAWRHRAIVA